jgi:hypothetical protein
VPDLEEARFATPSLTPAGRERWQNVRDYLDALEVPGASAELCTPEGIAPYWHVFFANDISLDVSDEQVTINPASAANRIRAYYNTAVRRA